jgi:peptidyl-prolyl cis-trans isomerase SurA
MRKIFIILLLMASSAHAAITEIDRIVAVVNDDVILESELKNTVRTIRGQLAQRKVEAPSAEALRKQVLERMILNRLQLQVAEQTGVTVNDSQLNSAIEGVARRNNMSITQFRDTLERDGFSFIGFREDMRREMIISRLVQRQVKQRINITDQEVDNFLATHKTQRGSNAEYHLQHILISLPDGASAEQITRAQAKADDLVARLRGGADFTKIAAANSDSGDALEGGDLGWRNSAQLPSLFAEDINTMQQGEISSPIRSPSGFHIVKLTELRNAGDTERHVIQQTHARHILISANELTSNDDARARLQQLRLRLQGGEDFATLARSHSDDRGSASNGGDLGWTSPGDLVKQFEDVMNDLPLNTVSNPFNSPFGWHIIEVLGRRTQDDTTKFIRSAARQAIGERKAEEETQAWLRRIRDEAFVEYRLNE